MFANVSWPATGVLGDAVDLGTLLKWAKRFWDDNLDPDWADQFEDWPASVRLEVAEASMDLVKAFDGMDQAHRKYFEQTGNKGQKRVGRLSATIRGRSTNVSIGNRKPELYPVPCVSSVRPVVDRASSAGRFEGEVGGLLFTEAPPLPSWRRGLRFLAAGETRLPKPNPCGSEGFWR